MRDPLLESPILSEDQNRAYAEQGYLRLGRVLTDVGLEAMRTDGMAAWRAKKGDFDPAKTWLQNALLSDIPHRSAVVRDCRYRGPLVDVAQQLIGPNIKGVTSQLTCKLRGNTKAFGWHQDNGCGELDPYNALTALTALDDTDEQNGCPWIVPGSHKRGQIEPGLKLADKQAEKSIELAVDERQAIPVPMRAGDPHENIGRRVVSWEADDERFPDQYQLDHIVEVEASANGYEQGYSGWVQLEDGRVFVVNYTDDTAPVAEGHGSGYGIPWIRGTFLSRDDLPLQKSKFMP